MAFDGSNTAAVVPNREATRLVSCSQEGSGAFVARLPDLTVSSSIIGSDAFLVILQRRLGLYLTALAPSSMPPPPTGRSSPSTSGLATPI